MENFDKNSKNVASEKKLNFQSLPCSGGLV